MPEMESEPESLPAEMVAEINESNALITEAKKRRAAVEQARQFYKGDHSARKREDRKKSSDRINDLKKKLPCARCGQTGHWKDDPECKMNKKLAQHHSKMRWAMETAAAEWQS